MDRNQLVIFLVAAFVFLSVIAGGFYTSYHNSEIAEQLTLQCIQQKQPNCQYLWNGNPQQKAN